MTFDEAGKILQVRLQWDQGSLLKQVEAIGKSGRNWPIRDSQEQIAFLRGCIKSSGTSAPTAASHNETVARNRGSSNNAFRDPHASLTLFGPRDEIEAHDLPTVVSPYGGNGPRQRSFTEILGDEPDSPSAARQRMSPSKAGQGKNFQPMRIFDGSEHAGEPEKPKSNANRSIRPNPKKFSHFDFADGTDPQDAPQAGKSGDERPKSKHDSQWSFDDFTTPQKVKPSRTMRTQDVRHWDTDKDAVNETPEEHHVKPRRDVEAHFELQDDGEKVPQPKRPNAKPPGYNHNEGLGLYKNQLFDKDDSVSHDRALGNITNIKDRNKDFDHHFDITDDSPAPAQRNQQVPEARMKAVKMMDANWSSYDKSPTSQKENKPDQAGAPDDNGIYIAGDGMGGRKGTNRDWLYGESDEAAQAIPSRRAAHAVAAGVPLDQSAKIHIAGDGMGGKKGTDRDWLYNEDQKDTTTSIPGRKPGSSGVQNDELRDTNINIAGDGMGGRKGTDRDWLYNEAQTDTGKSVPGRKPGSSGVPNNENRDTKINIAGDGMGGRKGTNRDWLYGDTSEQSRQQTTTTGKKDFWDF